MTRPPLLQSRSDGRFYSSQLKAFRGLRKRVDLLQRSWSNDTEQLDQSRLELLQRYAEGEARLLAGHSDQKHSAIEDWDLARDQALEYAEREFLTSVEREKRSIEKLKENFLADKQALKKRREDDTVKAHKTLEQSKAAAFQLRESIRSKLENERRYWSGALAELNEWMLLKTGRVMAETGAPIPPNTLEEIHRTQDLQRLAKTVEERKRNLSDSLSRIRIFAKSKGLAFLGLQALGPILCISGAAICWWFGVPILFVFLLATIGTLVLTASLHYMVRPLLGRSLQRFAPELHSLHTEVLEWLSQGSKLADQNYQNDLQKSASDHALALERIETEYRANRENLQRMLEKNTEQVRTSQQLRRWDLISGRKSQMELSDHKWGPILTSMEERFHQERTSHRSNRDGEVKSLQNRFYQSQLRYAERWRKGAEHVSNWMDRINSFFRESQPDWNDECFVRGDWSRDPQNLIWRIGSSDFQHPLSDAAAACSPELRSDGVEWPVAFDLLSHGAIILHATPECESLTDGLIGNVLLRSITSLPAGAMRMTIIDPQGLGKKVSWLMALADVDPGLVGDRVWTQPLHIADRLASIARSCEDIIQQSLRDKYRNLYEYNLTAGPMALPYRLIVWDQFPFGLDDSSWQSLCSILAAGGRCGVGVILRLSKSHVWPSIADPKKLEEFGLHLDFDIVDGEERVSLRQNDLRHAPIRLVSPPNSEQIKSIMRHQLDHVSQLGRLIVPFDSIAVPSEERQVTSSAESLAIPLGVAASGRTQLMKLGFGTAQHVLIAGKTGSGKSSLLHTMITSAALKYSPEELRLVLLDFKKGVEFQVYSEAKVPHADIIGIESKREFGVSTLEYIDRIMHARGEAFRTRGVQDLPSLEKKHPEVRMPRILIVIDEFQELFVEDDKISQQASMLMDRIVRQGRSFGIHLVLASQTLGGAYSLPRTTLAQMAVRIALQCDSSDAMLILGEDNTAAERLRFSGQAIYNEAGGRIESNQGFQVAYIDKETQLSFLHQIPSAPIPQDATTNPMGRCIVFEGHKPAVWDEQSLERLLQKETKKDDGSFPMILGDSVSIDPPILRWIQRNAGRNIVVVGPDESVAASILAGTIQGIQWLVRSPITGGRDIAGDAANDEMPKVFVLNGARSEDLSLTEVIHRCSGLSGTRVISPRDIESFFTECKKELDKRLLSGDASHPVQLICIPNISRFRELRKGDEFAFGGGDSSPQPDAILTELLRDGPTVGIHVWLWADSASTLGRWLSRQSLRDLELRVLMQMSANDSNQLIDSNLANKLEPHVALVQDEMDGKPTKFRPFAWKTLPAFQ